MSAVVKHGVTMRVTVELRAKAGIANVDSVADGQPDWVVWK